MLYYYFFFFFFFVNCIFLNHDSSLMFKLNVVCYFMIGTRFDKVMEEEIFHDLRLELNLGFVVQASQRSL